MQFEIATLDDIPKLCELLNYLFEQEAEFQPDTASQIRGLSAIINDNTLGDIIVAKDNDNDSILAMVNLLYTVSTALGGRVAILEDMVVAPDYRQQNIGSSLINYAIEHCKNKRCKRITLLTDSDNYSAQAFYKKQGFIGSDMQVFRKFLSD